MSKRIKCVVVSESSVDFSDIAEGDIVTIEQTGGKERVSRFEGEYRGQTTLVGKVGEQQTALVIWGGPEGLSHRKATADNTILVNRTNRQ